MRFISLFRRASDFSRDNSTPPSSHRSDSNPPHPLPSTPSLNPRADSYIKTVDTASSIPSFHLDRKVSDNCSSPWDSSRRYEPRSNPLDSSVTASLDRPSTDPPHRPSRYVVRGNGPARFAIRQPSRLHARAEPGRNARPKPSAEYFGTKQHDDGAPRKEIRRGEEILFKFLQSTLGPRGQNIAVRLLNLTPITSNLQFAYVVNQASEDSDLEIIRRDLESGRLYAQGRRLLAGAWSNLLLGDRFQAGSSKKQRHELTYRRSSCSCVECRVKLEKAIRAESNRTPGNGRGEMSARERSFRSVATDQERTPNNSAKANFVGKTSLPSTRLLTLIGASASQRELEIGCLVRLNYRSSAKLKFTKDFEELFGNFAYTGPADHEHLYRKVTTIGANYYQNNKGKRERKVYIQGELVKLPVQIGIVKLGTQPTCVDERGATFILHRKQVMSIYVGEIVLEGNSLGSFINTNIRYYIGFGEERGACPVFPNKTLGTPRRLGINELLLHHHMVQDLEVKCI